MNKRGKTGVIVVAGGTGTRALRHGEDVPKQYRLLGGRAVLARTISSFLDMDGVDYVLPVIGAGHGKMFAALGLFHPKLLECVVGGAERQESCYLGLLAFEKNGIERVLIHDGARPFVSPELVERVCLALKNHDGALPVLPVTDTIKRSKNGKSILATMDRNELWAAQTPQGFLFEKILGAHRDAHSEAKGLTDDAAVAEWAGLDVVLVAGDEKAFKITSNDDFVRAEAELNKENNMETRVGSGMDIHQFEPGDNVRLGGVDIAHNARLKGHSDADAALHVLTDALLGALAEGDIGAHFPPSEAKWKGAPSDTFLAFAAKRVQKRGGRIVHLDLTINCELPKIGPVAEQMRKNIARICSVSVGRVSVKATTSEKMGFVGRGEGIMTLGTATIEIPGGEN